VRATRSTPLKGLQRHFCSADYLYRPDVHALVIVLPCYGELEIVTVVISIIIIIIKCYRPRQRFKLVLKYGAVTYAAYLLTLVTHLEVKGGSERGIRGATLSFPRRHCYFIRRST